MRRLIANVALGAVQVIAKAPNIRGGIDARWMDVNSAGAESQSSLQGLDYARALGGRDAKPIGDNVEDLVVASGPFAMHARIALRLQVCAHFFFAEIFRNGDRKRNGQVRVTGGTRALHKFTVNAVCAIAPHGACTAAAKKSCAARKQQLQMII
jgi:hypothetical protein